MTTVRNLQQQRITLESPPQDGLLYGVSVLIKVASDSSSPSRTTACYVMPNGKSLIDQSYTWGVMLTRTCRHAAFSAHTHHCAPSAHLELYSWTQEAKSRTQTSLCKMLMT